MPGCPPLLVPLLLILVLVPNCRPQVGNTGALGDGTLFGGANQSSMQSAKLILMDPAAEATTVTDRTDTTALQPSTKKDKDDTIMIQYRRFQRPQRRDLPIGLGGGDAEYTSPACEQFNHDEVMAGDRRAIVFKSPNYPNNYPNNTDCVRRLTAEPGFLLQLDFRDTFHIEPSEGCRFDYLEVRDGAHGYSALRGQFCGQTFPPILTSTDRYLWLRFHSDENIEYSGFKAVYRTVPRPERDVPPPMEMCYFNITGMAQGYINRSDIDRNDPNRVSMSLEHKMPIDCMWVIQVDQGWKINLNFITFKLDKPNDCESNFVDVFSTRTDLPSRLKNFCGSIADSVTSELNVLHIRFYADYSAKNSSFESLFTAFRERSTGACDPETEYDCEDNSCIAKELRCNGVHNCRFKWDEEECKPKSGSFADVITSSEQLIIIMVIFCLLVFGMCFAFVYNCIGKLLRDHRIIQEHMRQSREDRLDEMGRKSPTVSRHCSQHSSEHELGAEDTPTTRRHHQDCYLAGTDDAMLPMLINRGTLPTPPSNGDAIFVRNSSGGMLTHSAHSVRTHSVGCGSVVVADVADAEDDSDTLPSAPLPLPPPLPEMRDMECQTRESLFHANGSSLSNHEPLTSRSNSDRSCTPPPPPPPTISRLVNMKNSRNSPRPAPFSTFGYVDEGAGAATLPRWHKEIRVSPSKRCDSAPVDFLLVLTSECIEFILIILFSCHSVLVQTYRSSQDRKK
ncbi:uncharacterized protein LOC117645776 [Thrips palmi]|uniref:Uncharacterized protein LOC117645776 n=1 Tax=Thrips palmi TaxID=161013 RepID=A0A6P8Z5Y8_THRPL|nr:uncharacterized protein LOC117645776 [Thrips palmi]